MEHKNRVALVLSLVLAWLAWLPSVAADGTQTGAALGESCQTSADCLTGLACDAGHCVREGVPQGGACDAERRCGKGLECRAGTCRTPCFCALPCTVSEAGRCEQSVNPPCAKVGGKCPAPGCFVDARGACVKAKSERRPCELSCP